MGTKKTKGRGGKVEREGFSIFSSALCESFMRAYIFAGKNALGATFDDAVHFVVLDAWIDDPTLPRNRLFILSLVLGLYVVVLCHNLDKLFRKC